MKLITAIIKPFKLEEVREALAEVGGVALLLPKLKALVDKKAILNFIVVQSTRSIFYRRSKLRWWLLVTN